MIYFCYNTENRTGLEPISKHVKVNSSGQSTILWNNNIWGLKKSNFNLLPWPASTTADLVLVPIFSMYASQQIYLCKI